MITCQKNKAVQFDSLITNQFYLVKEIIDGILHLVEIQQVLLNVL